jgi:molecular chaperone DnaK
MVKEAESNASADKQRRDAIEKKNQLDSLIYQAEKQVAENAEKLDEADKAEINEAIAAAKADLESQDVAKLDAARQRVEAALHKVAEKLYKTTGGADAGGARPTGEASEADSGDDVIDAEFTQEKEDS